MSASLKKCTSRELTYERSDSENFTMPSGFHIMSIVQQPNVRLRSFMCTLETSEVSCLSEFGRLSGTASSKLPLQQNDRTKK
jgi:hypothetical protein